MKLWKKASSARVHEIYPMGWVPNDKEIAAVLQLSGRQRYAYSVKKIADQEEVWSLHQPDGWALAGDDEGRELVPVWPHAGFADLCARDAWTGFLPRSIQLNVWLERWIPGLERDGQMVAVFPTPANHGLAVSPARLNQDLQAALSRYE